MVVMGARMASPSPSAGAPARGLWTAPTAVHSLGHLLEEVLLRGEPGVPDRAPRRQVAHLPEELVDPYLKVRRAPRRRIGRHEAGQDLHVLGEPNADRRR